MQANQAVAQQIRHAGKLDSEQEPFLLESFAIELARKRTSVPLTFASYSEQDGLVLVAGTIHGTAIVRSN